MVKTTTSHPCLVSSSDIYIAPHHRPIHLPSNHVKVTDVTYTQPPTGPPAVGPGYLVSTSMSSASGLHDLQKDSPMHAFYPSERTLDASHSTCTPLLYHSPSSMSPVSTFPELTFTTQLTSPCSPNTSDNRLKHPCLPYGLYYDCDDESDKDTVVTYEVDDYKSLDDDWAMDDNHNCDVYYRGFKPHVDTGPTLAELNSSTDACDTDDLFATTQSTNCLSIDAPCKTSPTSRPIVYESPLKSSPFVPDKVSPDSVKDEVKQLKAHLAPCDLNARNEVLTDTSDSGNSSSGIVERREDEEKCTEDVSPVTESLVGKKISTVTFSATVTSSTGVDSEVIKIATASQSTLTSPDLARIRNSSLSTEGSISSHDEGFASQQEDSDEEDAGDSSDDDSFYGDYDAKDLLGATTSDDHNNKWSLNIGRTRKNCQQRYFWQYNVQAKGPKGNKVLTLSSESPNDPHILMEASDPVFSTECSIKGVKHAGKARRGDGNDLTPNPRKLLMIGLELKKLSHIINELTPVAEVPVNARGKSRKEKNKLASRACRLKKKAQHEANKIKLFGLQQEHKKTLAILDDIKVCIKKFTNDSGTLYVAKELIGAKHSIPKVAGQTPEFVNMILDNVASGHSDGGLTAV